MDLKQQAPPDSVDDTIAGKRDRDARSPSPVLKSDGISLRGKHLRRRDVVQEIIQTARARQHVILGSPPAMGKTSLIQLLEQQLKSEGASVIRMQGIHLGVQNMLETLREEGIRADIKALQKLRNTWLVVDDAQNVYASEYFPFWQFLVKTIAGANVDEQVFVVIAATYNLSTPDSPVQFKDLAHIHTDISSHEARELFCMFAETWNYDDWDHFLENILSISELIAGRHHVGVIIAAVRLLDEARKHPRSQALDEKAALAMLRSEHFINRLDRCFQLPSNLPVEGRDRILDVLLSDGSLDVTDDALLTPFIRAGILTAFGEFSCIASRWYYNRRCFPNRSQMKPASLDDLVISAVGSLSSLRMKGAAQDGFPKEAAFQHLFNEALSIHLPLRNHIVPELGTFATSPAGGTISGELDFYINGELKWCLELLRMGDKIGDHIARFDKFNGKYSEIPSNDFLVIDCRGSKTGRGTNAMSSRCTLYFADDFKTCICKMRTKPEIQISLMN